MPTTPLNLVQRVIRRTQRIKRRKTQKEALQAPLPPTLPLVLHAHEDVHPNYPEDWINVTEEASHDYLLPTRVANVASRTTYALAETNGATLQSAPNNVKQAVLAIRSISTELHEHAHTVHGIKDLVLALKKLVNDKNIDREIFPEDERAFARNYFK